MVLASHLFFVLAIIGSSAMITDSTINRIGGGNMLCFQFHPQKATQAVAYFLNAHGGQMYYLGLIKLLYMADRLAFERFNWPITGDVYFSMEYGPVLSRVYRYIQKQVKLNNHQVNQGIRDQENNGFEYWSQYIGRISGDQYQVCLIASPGNSELCEAEEDVLRDVYQNRGDFDRFELAEITHQFPEWQNPLAVGKKRLPLPPLDVLHALKKTDQEIQWIQEETDQEIYLQQLVNG
jgi:hypothetical protein